MRKGQSEVIGLMVIVLILIFMGVLYLGFANLAGNDTLASQRVGIETENALNAVSSKPSWSIVVSATRMGGLPFA